MSGVAETLHSLARFGLFAASILAAVFATMLLLVVTIPEANDYALGTTVKRERLERIEGPKVVLVGGSNLAYGIDTLALEAITACPVVNMGMNGYLGVNFMLAEVRNELHAGDTVVLAFEWDNFVKDVEGIIEEILAIVKVEPATWNILDWSQRLRLLYRAVPYAAREKAQRIFGDAAALLVTAPLSEESRKMDFVLTVENFAGFNAEGDLTSQAGKTWPFGVSDGLNLTEEGLDPEVPVTLNRFAQEMQERGVRVVLSYSPVARTFYNKHAAVIAELHQQMVAGSAVDIPRPPQDYVYDDEMFFDESYHLSDAGRLPRTQQLGGDLLSVNGGVSPCIDAGR